MLQQQRSICESTQIWQQDRTTVIQGESDRSIVLGIRAQYALHLDFADLRVSKRM